MVIGAGKHAPPKAKEDGEFEAMERIDSAGVSGRQLQVGEYKVLKLINVCPYVQTSRSSPIPYS
jgi:hypothetical protein